VESGDGLDDPHRPLPTQDILQFYDFMRPQHSTFQCARKHFLDVQKSLSIQNASEVFTKLRKGT